MSLHTWYAFFAAAWLISLSPGPGAVSCMASGQRYGYPRAFWNILGLQLGVLFLVAICAAGLGALLAASQSVFAATKWLGVLYLIWLGVQQWRSTAAPVNIASGAQQAPWSMVLSAFLINASNPKGILFMLAVLPQFIDPQAAQWPQYALCAATLLFTDVLVMSAYTLLAARALRALREPTHVRWLNRGFGALFVAAGILLAGLRRG